MCGIAGLISQVPINSQKIDSFENVLRSFDHRGPDYSDTWIDNSSNIILGHNRLSIIDLSASGHQPMSSMSGKLKIVFNGEIYNFQYLKKKLDSVKEIRWKGSSDTEILIEHIDHFGLSNTLESIEGMFAFALWDIEKKNLQLVRDRAGEKPLYYALLNGEFIFASEIHEINNFFMNALNIDHKALEQYIKKSCISAPSSIFEEIKKLEPGQTLKFDATKFNFSVSHYWVVKDIIQKETKRRSIKLDNTSAKKSTLNILKEVVDSQIISDVPIGAFLSGGIDSTLISAIANDSLGGKLNTFSISFDDKSFDESSHAKVVADKLKTNHIEFKLHEDEALSLLKQVPYIYDEPFADSSQIPTLLLCRESRKYITVALTGDGGDEVFGGYNRYIYGPKFLSLKKIIPNKLFTSFGINIFAKPLIKLMTKLRFLPASSQLRLSRFVDVFRSSKDLSGFYENITDLSNLSDELLIKKSYENIPSTDNEEIIDLDINDQEALMMYDFMSYLPSDILTKVDRSSMHFSLETRAPFLDRRTVEHAWSLNISHKIKRNSGKHVLKEIINDFIPINLIDRPKQGFSIPLDDWLRNPLYSWISLILDEERIRGVGIFDPIEIKNILLRHQSGENLGAIIWNVIIFQLWHEKSVDNLKP